MGLTVDQVVQAVMTMSSDELGKLKEVIEGREGLASFEKVFRRIVAKGELALKEAQEADFTDLNEATREMEEALDALLDQEPAPKSQRRLSTHSRFFKEYEEGGERREELARLRIWKTHEGKELQVSDMDDNHLINAAKLLQRKAREWRASIPCPISNGEVAQEQIEADFEALHGLDDDDLTRQHFGAQYEMLIEELEERGLEIYS